MPRTVLPLPPLRADRGRGPVLTEQGYRTLIERRTFESNGALSEPTVWKQLLAETGM